MNRPGPLKTMDTSVTSPIRDMAKYGIPLALPHLTASGEIVEVQRIARERYDVELPDAYCRDLIAFVEALTHDHPRG